MYEEIVFIIHNRIDLFYLMRDLIRERQWFGSFSGSEAP